MLPNFSIRSISILFVLILFCATTDQLCARSCYERSSSQNKATRNKAKSKKTKPVAQNTNQPPFKLKSKSPTPPLIVIDAGHGGEDFGTYSTSGKKTHEKHLTLTTAQMIGRYLHQMGYRSILTRTTDIFIPLQERAIIANNYKATLFVSVHYNSAPNKNAEGIEVFYHNEEGNIRTGRSKLLAKNVLDQLIQNTEAKSRGVKQQDFVVIRETKMPAILVEGGFLTNENEITKLRNPNYLKLVALGIANGIDEYIKSQVNNK